MVVLLKKILQATLVEDDVEEIHHTMNMEGVVYY
jgi:hypothetical protein